MKWITRERPKIDRIACPWLIKGFIDKEAEIIYVPFDEVVTKAAELGAIPFDVPGVEFTHYKEKCTFDYFLEKYAITDEALHRVAVIVRAADTDRYDISAEAAGLWAISAGLAHNYTNDHELLEKGMVIYDALYSWATHFYKAKHQQGGPFEHLLLSVISEYINKKKKAKKIPAWVKELKELIQDQVDTNLSLKEVSKELNINPSYLSREFSKYFDDLSFGEYLRKQRIEKAIGLLETSSHTLTEIAYLAGFSDQSHFTRIFKKHTGSNPSAYRKKVKKSKADTKS